MVLTSTPLDRQQTESSKTIVLVEDDLTNALMLDLLLQTERGYQTVRFASGEEVLGELDTLKTSRPLIFLVDHHLSQMTGLDLCEHLHTIEGFEEIPAILLTAYHFNQAEQQRIAQQHLTVLYKPFDINDFLGSIQHAVR